MLTGKWTYRSFHNDPLPVGNDPSKALGLLFGEGVLEFHKAPISQWKATLSFGSDWNMNLGGFIEQPDAAHGAFLHGTGVGRDDTNTAGWVYQYRGIVMNSWPLGTSEIPTIVGSVIRTVRHGNGAAGKVASFVAVKLPETSELK